jgi:hypothetical protein
MSELQDRPLLYHCFPQAFARVAGPGRARPGGYSPETEAAVGLETLRLILEFGLLLKSEDLKVHLPEPASGPADAAPVRAAPWGGNVQVITQRRACFIFGAVNDLNRRRPIGHDQVSHLDLFGRFAIAIDPRKAKDLGFLPVNYFYRNEKAEDATDLRALSGLMANYLLEVREVLTFLAYAERRRRALSSEDPLRDGDLEHTYEEGGLTPALAAPKYRDRILAEIQGATPDQLEFLSRLMAFDRFHIGILADSINLQLATHQTVDSASFGEEFLYYYQQEWRVIVTTNSNAVIFPLASDSRLDPAERDFVAEFLERADRLSARSGGRPDLGDSLLLHAFHKPARPFHSCIEAVLCPRAATRAVKDLLAEYGLRRLPVIEA